MSKDPAHSIPPCPDPQPAADRQEGDSVAPASATVTLLATFHGLHDAWHEHCHQALGSSCHVPVRVGRDGMPAPAASGFVRHRGLYYGQRADWRFTLSDGRGLHVREFIDRYEVHWDRVCPLRKPVRHLVYDTPWLFASTLMALAIPAGIGLWRRGRPS